MLTDLADVLRGAGLTVVEVDGWKERGHGPMASVEGVTCHHTASGRRTGATLGLSTVRDGRPDLAGPLAQLYLSRAGTFYVVAAGRCYHAGKSRKPGYTNGRRIGIEALAAGDGWAQDWPDAQVEAFARGCKALAEHYRFPVSEVLGHKETCSPTGRKIDPTFDMADFRRRVEAVKPHPAQEDVVDGKTLQAIATAVAEHPIRNKQAGGKDGPPSTIEGSIVALEYRSELIVAEQADQRRLLEQILERLPPAS